MSFHVLLMSMQRAEWLQCKWIEIPKRMRESRIKKILQQNEKAFFDRLPFPFLCICFLLSGQANEWRNEMTYYCSCAFISYVPCIVIVVVECFIEKMSTSMSNECNRWKAYRRTFAIILHEYSVWERGRRISKPSLSFVSWMSMP